MRAADVMTTNVITVAPDASVLAVAELLANNSISGVPVVDSAGKLVGVVSEGDLLHRTETGTERRVERKRPRWFETFTGDRDLARSYIKSHSRTVRDIMTPDVITVTEATELDEIANLLETKRIKRVPVLRDGKVVGIVSRSNLVRALVAAKPQSETGIDADDRTIRRRILAELQGQEWASRVWAADIIVSEKVVHIWCSDDRSDEERRALRVVAENTPGVRGIEEHIVAVPLSAGF
jgi:CBS domain-containing protein